MNFNKLNELNLIDIIDIINIIDLKRNIPHFLVLLGMTFQIHKQNFNEKLCSEI